MNASDLGKKIKEARLAKKMTQSQVVGNFITRNMLSQIESGSAMPSVKTLTYLASVLDLPLDLLIGSENDAQDAFTLLQSLKQNFRNAQYEAVIHACNHICPEIEDEMYALGARACLLQAKALIDQDQLADVSNLLRQSIAFSEQGLYQSESIRESALKLLNQQAEKLSRYYQNFSEAKASS